MDRIAKEKVTLTSVIGVGENEYLLNDGTKLLKTSDLPDLKAGDRIEISYDGQSVLWNFVIS